MRKKDLLSKALLGKSSPLRSLSYKARTERLIVLAYHRIDDIPPKGYPFQDETVSATPQMFRAQLAFLKRHFFVTTFVELSAILAAGETIPRNTAIITFDDGYRDNYDLALPILSEFDLPAVVYVVTENINSGQPFWFDIISYSVMHAPNGRLLLKSGPYSIDFVDDNRRLVRREIGNIVRRVDDSDRLQIIDELLEYSGCRDKIQDTRRMVLNWNEIREMHGSGIEIGSHTVSHPFLTRISAEQLEYELVESKRTIESHIQSPVVSLSYPTGGRGFYDQRVIRVAQDSGYEFAVSYDHAALRYSSSKRYEIPRVHVELDVSQSLFEAQALLPQFFLLQRSLRAH